MFDFAKLEFKKYWFRHPVIGDASFDAFERNLGNPVHKGSYPYEWPVNCFLYKDPVSGNLYAYVSRYFKGYWSPEDREETLDCVAYKSCDNGSIWEYLGVVMEGTNRLFDSRNGEKGGAADLSIVYDEGVYHMVYGWVTKDAKNGGIAYARSLSPEGPFVTHPEPVHNDMNQELLLGRYKRVYAPSLFKRKDDWMVIAMMSTPANLGGTWALVCMTSSRPEGPYTAPKLLLYPQSRVFHPPVVEFFPAFEDQQYIYCPFTSVALNRSFQVIFRAEKEKAHISEAWEVYRYGSLWHKEDNAYEAKGIWGQTFAGLIDGDDFKVLFPSKTEEDIGTINMASCKWNRMERKEGFTVSAPNGPAFTFIQQEFSEFELKAELKSGGEKAVVWSCNAPVGPNSVYADSTLHQLMFTGMMKFEWDKDKWSVIRVDQEGTAAILASGTYPGPEDDFDRITVSCGATSTKIVLNGQTAWEINGSPGKGRIGILAGKGSNVHVKSFCLDRMGKECFIPYLATEGLIGAGLGCALVKPEYGYDTTADPGQQWIEKKSGKLRFGTGCTTSKKGMMVKWNFVGSKFRLWCPRGPEYGKFYLYLDGRQLGLIDLHSSSEEDSQIVYESSQGEYGYHSVVIEVSEGTVVCDSLEFCI